MSAVENVIKAIEAAEKSYEYHAGLSLTRDRALGAYRQSRQRRISGRLAGNHYRLPRDNF